MMQAMLATPLGAGTTYTWKGTTSTDWTVSGNWSPSSGFPGSNSSITDDEVVFDGSGVQSTTDLKMTGNNGRTIGRITISGSSDRSVLNPTGSGGVLTLTGVDGVLLSNTSASSVLTMSSGNPKYQMSLANSGIINVSNTAGTIVLNAQILASSSAVTKTGAGLLVMNNNELYTGSTFIQGGTLRLSSRTEGSTIQGRLNSTASISISGGTLLLDGGTSDAGSEGSGRLRNSASVTLGGAQGAGTIRVGLSGAATTIEEKVGTLTLSGAGNVLDFGSGTSAIWRFEGSSGTFGSGSMTVYNWSGSLNGGGVDRLFFGTSAAGLTPEQASRVAFYSDDGSTYLGSGQMMSNGELVPVPEPGAAGALLALLAPIFWHQRRSAARRAQGVQMR